MRLRTCEKKLEGSDGFFGSVSVKTGSKILIACVAAWRLAMGMLIWRVKMMWMDPAPFSKTAS
jgi:hypothetical protein